MSYLMNVIKTTVICAYLLSGILIQGIANDDLSYDLDKIVTLRGKTFQDILILNADQHGLLFRHRRGIAKLRFSELSAALRGMYETLDNDFGSLEEPLESGSLIQGKAESEVQIDLITRNRIYLRPVQYRAYTPIPLAWQQHWPRYHSPHNLVNPYYKAAVLEDFLYTAELLPLPPGVNIVRLPSPTPWNFR